MVLFVKTEDLAEGKRRIMAYLKDQLRRNNPFFIEIQKTEPVKLDMQDLVDKYSSVGKKSIRDDYYISKDQKMLLILIKPMWDTNELGKTKVYVEKLRKDLAALLQERDRPVAWSWWRTTSKMGNDRASVAYGFTGSYKTAVDDSYAIEESLSRCRCWPSRPSSSSPSCSSASWVPTLIVVIGTVLGTIITMGFTYVTVGELNMITSILGGILMGFGIDYGIHFIFRTRLELGRASRYDVAIRTRSSTRAGRRWCPRW